MHPATVEILITKGKFDSAVAMAVAEALDVTLQNAQLVSVPILDNRLAAINASINARFAAMEARIDSRFAAAEASIDSRFAAAEASIDSRFAAAEASLNTRFAEAEAKNNARFAAVEVRLTQLHGEITLLDERMKRHELRYILCTALIVVGNSHLGEVVSFIAGLIHRLP